MSNKSFILLKSILAFRVARIKLDCNKKSFK